MEERLAIQHRPDQIDPDVFIAPNAVVLGDVTLKRLASVWYGVVIRGETERIVVGERSNVQDGCVLHADPGFPCIIGRGVTVGHRAVVHGATIHDDVIVGMGAIVLNGAVIETGCVIGAGAVVLEGAHVPAGSLVLGNPGKVAREVSQQQRQLIHLSAESYVQKGQAYKAVLTA